MNKDELVSAITEALEKYEQEKQVKNLDKSKGWQIFECMVITLFFITFMSGLVAIIPTMKHGNESYTMIEAMQKAKKAESFIVKRVGTDEDIKDAHGFLSEFYSNAAGWVAVFVILLILYLFAVFTTNNHTKEDVIKHLNLYFVATSFVIMIIQLLSSIE